MIVDGEIVRWAPDRPTRVDDLVGLDELSYLPSRGLLVRRSIFDAVGGLNLANYPLQFVDVDFSFRLRAAGSDFRIVTNARTRHVGGGSTPRGYALFLHERNVQTFGATWFPDAPPAPVRFVEVAGSRPDAVGVPRHPVHPAVDAAMLASIAQSAADTLTHIGRVHSALWDQLQHTSTEAAETLGAQHALREELRIAQGDLTHAHRDLTTIGADLAAARADAESLRAAVIEARAEAESLRAAVIEARAALVAKGEETQRLRDALAVAQQRLREAGSIDTEPQP